MNAPEAGSWWTETAGPALAQGDYLPDCYVPDFHPDFGSPAATSADIPVDTRDCIILTQSCDLVNDKAQFVALCPLYTIIDFEQVNSSLRQKGAWERVRKGQVEGLHLIASIDQPEDNRTCFVVDFRQIYSLPADYLKAHAASLGSRWRLESPYLEHFSQAFARFFMRVGLPSSIPPYK